MLKETSLSGMRSLGLSREERVLVNRGRGNSELEPADGLFDDFNEAKKRLEQEHGRGSAEAHNEAFLEVDYERRFREQIAGDERAQARLAELAETGSRADLYLVCYEGETKACHRRILLRILEEEFDADVSVDGVEPRRA